MKHLRRTLLGLAVLALAGAAVLPATAQRRLHASIYFVQAVIPRTGTERALLGFARAHNARRLMETTAEPLAQRKWLADLVVNFNGPPGDLEFHCLFYDVEDGPRRFVDDMSTYLNDRNQTTYVQRVRLERPKFKPNRHMNLVVTVRHDEVGNIAFEMIGEEVHHSGQVDFSDSEASGHTHEDDNGTERAAGD